MDNSFKNNDAFKQFVKSKLADYSQEPHPNSWNELEQSLTTVQKTKVIRTRWIASSVAAVAAALIGVFFLFQSTNNEFSTQTADTQTEQPAKTFSKKEKPLLSRENSSQPIKTTPSLIADNTALKHQKEASTITTIKKGEESPVSIIKTHSNAKKEDASDAVSEKTTNNNNIDEQKKQQMLQDFINEGNRLFSEANNIKPERRKSKLAVSLTGQSAFAASQQNTTVPTTLRASLSDVYGNYTMAQMQAYNEGEPVTPESKTNHKQPVSFGILTSYNITPRLQVETGLIYTYLSSETTNKSDNFSATDKVQFHYLGVPINLNYRLLTLNKIDLYVSTGAMIEKDIDGKMTVNKTLQNSSKVIVSATNNGYTDNNSSKINQKNPQLSILGGLGISYPLYKNTSLFGKIGGRYYINANNEYKTYYSDEKFGLDMQLGIKFNF